LGKRKTGALRREQQQKYMNQPYYNNIKIQEKTVNLVTENYKHSNKKQVELLPQSVNQEKYILSLIDRDLDIVVVSGPAGTGKTYLAMLAAIKSLRKGDCDKIILTRPAVAVDDEKHGFLPGDLNSKMEPWVRPLIDVVQEFYSTKEIKYMLEEQIIEIVPLAFCRGRNFKKAFIILDEAQNATPSQLKMLMTRIGLGSKIVITGDIEQTDRSSRDNGIDDLIKRLDVKPTAKISVCKFETRDIRRHPIIESVLELYS
jgi:phosphate starvation-inducible PhoH-like protein